MAQVRDVDENAHHFLPERVVFTGGSQEQMRRTTELQGKKNSIVQQEMGGIVRIGMGIIAQDAVFNPSPLPDLQVGPGLKFCLAMDMVK